MSFFLQTALLSAITIGATLGAFSQQAATPTHHDASKSNAILVNLSQPVYPPLARHANIRGEVAVAVTVHPNGTTEVALESGHAMLKQAALDSAKQSRFECRGCDSAVAYRLVYSFRLVHGNGCCSALSVPAEVTREPQASGQNDQRETYISITAEEKCLCDPGAEVIRKQRSLKCLYLWKCS